MEVQGLEVDVVGHGRAASGCLGRRIAGAKAAGHPLDPVTVIVPSNAAGLSARRLLAVGDAAGGLAPANLANVGFVTPLRLAELLGSAHIGDRRPLTNPVLAAAVRAALAEHPGMFAAVADHQATQAAVLSTYGELSRALPETRARIAAGSGRGAEVVRLIADVESRLDAFYDEDDLAEAATAHLATSPAAAVPLGTVVWHLPDRLSPAMARLVGSSLRSARPGSGVILAATGSSAVDAVTFGILRRAGVPIDATDEISDAAAAIEAPTADRLISVSDADEEVRQVVREVVQLVTDGTPLDRIAIFRPSPGSYARTLVEQLDGAGIPHNGPATRRLADTVAGRTLLGALALDEGGWGRGEVIALVTEAPVRTTDGLVSARRWDAASRRAGVVGGLDDWQEKLRHLEALLADHAAGRQSQELVTVRALAAFVDDLAEALAKLTAAESWAARSEAARALLSGLLGPEQRRVRWPEEEIDAAQRVDEALARLATLDDLEPNPTRITFEMAVASELDVTVGRVGRFGHGVLIAPLASAVGHDVDAVFVLGMAEGTCPAFRRDDALLPDADRQVAVDGELTTQDDRLLLQHRNYLAALGAGGRRRTLLFPRGDLRGRRDRLPSRWLLDSASALGGRRIFSSDVADLPSGVMRTVASYEDGVMKAGVHGSVVERDVAVLRDTPDPAGHPMVEADADLVRGFLARGARAGEAFTEWDGNLDGQAVASPATGTPLSPSRLEAYASCPFRYYLGSVLGLSERDDPERVVEISPAEKGSLVHLVLERFITEVLERPAGAPAPDEPWTPADRARVAELAEVAFVDVEARGLTGRPLMWRRTKAEVLADLDVFLTKDDQHRREARVRPVQAEMAFGLDGEPPLSIPLPSGRSLTFRGRADRVDQGDDGHLVVLDYKTGSGWGYDALKDDPVSAGTKLQLGVYAEAARATFAQDEVSPYYWIISSKGEYKKYGYRWSDEHRGRFLDVAEAIVDGIESGVFPARPGDYDAFWAKHDNCRFCEFDRICPRDREEHERATADAPELGVLERLRLRSGSGSGGEEA
jgi:RecB family exonuclease